MIEEKIQKDLVEAMKSHNERATSAIRSIKTAIQNEKVNGTYHELTDEDVLKLIQKLVKQRKESYDIYTEAKREDLAIVEKEEMEILSKYLPKQLSEEEVTEKVKAIIAELGATTIKDMGKVMGAANKQMSGVASGQVISKIVKSLLS